MLGEPMVSGLALGELTVAGLVVASPWQCCPCATVALVLGEPMSRLSMHGDGVGSGRARGGWDWHWGELGVGAGRAMAGLSICGGGYGAGRAHGRAVHARWWHWCWAKKMVR